MDDVPGCQAHKGLINAESGEFTDRATIIESLSIKTQPSYLHPQEGKHKCSQEDKAKEKDVAELYKWKIDDLQKNGSKADRLIHCILME